MAFLINIFAIILSLALVQSNHHTNKDFFLRKSSGENSEALVVVTWEENEDEINAECNYFTNKDEIDEILESSNDPPVEIISEDEMQEILDDCNTVDSFFNRVDEQGRRVDEQSDNKSTNFISKVQRTIGNPLIFPGTNWCGAGDVADGYEDVGRRQETDRCCRAHDMCNDTLAPKEERNGIKNNSPFTALSCECDHAFYDCLDKVNSVTSNSIGIMYFNILKKECYTTDYPNTDKCKKYRTIFKLKCVEYEKDTTKPKEAQWVPPRRYKKAPFPGPLTITLPF